MRDIGRGIAVALAVAGIGLLAAACTSGSNTAGAGSSGSSGTAVSRPNANSTQATGAPDPSGSAAADPQQVVDAAWLTADQMPFAADFHWKAMRNDPQGSSPIGRQLTSTVFYVANNTSLQALTMCADPGKLLPRTTGAQHTDFTATAGTGTNQASQYIFFFADAASAQRTYTWLQSQYSSSCLLNGSGAQVTQVGTHGTTEAAWLTLAGSSTLDDLPAYSREYFVLRGSTIAFVSVTSHTSSLPTAYDDTTQLSAIASRLCVYAGPCS